MSAQANETAVVRTVPPFGPASFCRMDERLVQAIAGGERLGTIGISACATVLLGAGAYGLAFGLWRAPMQAAYSAVKMPLLLFAVVCSSGVINTMLVQVLGLKLSLSQVGMCMLSAMAIAASVMGALSPVAAFLVMQAPPPDSRVLAANADAHLVAQNLRVYRVLLLGHVGAVGLSGLIGVSRLHRLLRRLTESRRSALGVMVIWLLVCGFVGCELSWMLSPFLCKPTQPPHVIAREYFQENFYERVWRATRELM